jgi:hyperosmotically inducible protein
MDQGTSEGDRKITQLVRQAVVKDRSLSFGAKNVKIITMNGKVTLRGPVKTDAERAAIESAAKNVTGVTHVDNQLEVKN